MDVQIFPYDLPFSHNTSVTVTYDRRRDDDRRTTHGAIDALQHNCSASTNRRVYPVNRINICKCFGLKHFCEFFKRYCTQNTKKYITSAKHS